ncbi:MAG: AAA family ATPase [Desulfitobacteriaceae bacterium]
MRIVALEVQNFRGIKHSKIAIPDRRVFCLVGAGDSTKSTLLEAIRWDLLQGWVINAIDSDFYQCDTKKSIIIRGTYTEIPDTLLSEEKYGYFIPSGKAVVDGFDSFSRGREDDDLSWDDEPKESNDLCLTVQLTVEASLEPKWEIICNSLEPKSLSVADRRLLLSNCIDNDFLSAFQTGTNIT